MVCTCLWTNYHWPSNVLSSYNLVFGKLIPFYIVLFYHDSIHYDFMMPSCIVLATQRNPVCGGGRGADAHLNVGFLILFSEIYVYL